MPRTKRKDKSRVVLRTGESQRADGTYHFSWTDANHKRRYVYAKTLDELRYKEEQIAKDKSDGIKAEARYTTVNDIYELWKDLKRGLKNNTFENYKYMYETFVRHQIGSKTVSSLRKTDIKRFYNYLADERHLKPATIDNIHTVLHQILDMAVDDDYIRNNPSNNVLKELKQSHCFQTEKRRALTKPEQELFLDYTFTTRMCEAGVNVKVIQDTLGHKDISTTLNIYTDVTKELRKSEFEGLDSYFKNEYNKVSV